MPCIREAGSGPVHIITNRTFSSDDFFSDGFSSGAGSSLSAVFFFSDFVFFVLQPVQSHGECTVRYFRIDQKARLQRTQAGSAGARVYARGASSSRRLCGGAQGIQ